MKNKICATCGVEKERSDFPSTGYCTRADGSKSQLVKPDCKPCHNKKVVDRFEALFVEFKIQFKCIRCGYDRCVTNIDFHHTDPNEKDFTIASRVSVKRETLIAEINKCIILCKICHGELHAGLWQLTELTGV